MRAPIRLQDSPSARAASTARRIWRSLLALDDSALEHVLGDWAFVVVQRIVVLAAASDLVGVVENLLDGAWHVDHLRNLDLADMA